MPVTKNTIEHKLKEEISQYTVDVSPMLEAKFAVLERCPSLFKTLDRIRHHLDSDCQIVIQGPSGSGKGLLAKWVHCHSSRRSGPFVDINCACLKENLLESELFGHTKGAFTNAIVEKRGLLELAVGGTLFLDEIHEMSEACQAKILKALEEGWLRRLGSNRLISTDFRLVVGSSTDLYRLTQEGKFMEPLYWRIWGCLASLPPLRERPDDLAALIEFFSGNVESDSGMATWDMSPSDYRCLLLHDWPGNVRQLEQFFKIARPYRGTDSLTVEALLKTIPPGSVPDASLDQKLLSIEKKMIIAVLQSSDTILEAASKLGWDERHMKHRMSVRGIRSREVRRKQTNRIPSTLFGRRTDTSSMSPEVIDM